MPSPDQSALDWIEEEFALGNAINRKTSSQMAFLEAD
jgi:hypothetical protein